MSSTKIQINNHTITLETNKLLLNFNNPSTSTYLCEESSTLILTHWLRSFIKKTKWVNELNKMILLYSLLLDTSIIEYCWDTKVYNDDNLYYIECSSEDDSENSSTSDSRFSIASTLSSNDCMGMGNCCTTYDNRNKLINKINIRHKLTKSKQYFLTAISTPLILTNFNKPCQTINIQYTVHQPLEYLDIGFIRMRGKINQLTPEIKMFTRYISCKLSGNKGFGVYYNDGAFYLQTSIKSIKYECDDEFGRNLFDYDDITISDNILLPPNTTLGFKIDCHHKYIYFYFNGKLINKCFSNIPSFLIPAFDVSDEYATISAKFINDFNYNN